MSNQAVVADQMYEVTRYSGNMTENFFIAHGGTVNVRKSNTPPANISAMITTAESSDLAEGYFTRPNRIPKYIAFETNTGPITSIDWEGFTLKPYTAP